MFGTKLELTQRDGGCMGLDMYLSAKKHLYSYEETAKDAVVGKAIGYMLETPMRINGVRADAMYWRKANAIHAWFVKNCQDGTDDCGEYYVSREQLKALMHECRKATVDDPNELEPVSGFFFGSTEKDEYYYEELERTATGIQKLLKQVDDSWSFYYQSSW
jgi:hypothetical protein